MKLRTVYRGLIHSSLYMGVSAAALVLTTTLLLGISVSVILLTITFLISFSSYNINRTTDLEEDEISHPVRANFIKKYEKHFKLITYFAYITGILFAFFNSFILGIIILLPPLIVLLYSMPWISKASFNRIKEIFLVKNMTVALTGGFVVTLLPIVFFQHTVDIAFVFVFLFIFFKIFGNTITFDIRDIQGDSAKNIKTVPSTLGVHKTKIILTVINLTALLVILIPALLSLLPPLAIIVSFVTIYTQIYIYLINKIDINFLTDVLADGDGIALGILSIIGALIL